MKLVRKIIRIAAIVMAPVMAVLSFFAMPVIIDGGSILMGTQLSAAQGETLARAIGFDLAPGETVDIHYYWYQFFREYQYTICMEVRVTGIASIEDFLSRIHPEAALEEFGETDDIYREKGDYSLYGSDDCLLNVYEWSGEAGFRIEGPTGKPALAVAEAFLRRKDLWHGYIFLLRDWRYLVPFGWLMEFAFITVLVVMRRKAKKATHSVGDGLPDVPGQ